MKLLNNKHKLALWRLFWYVARRKISVGSETKIASKARLACPLGGTIKIGRKCRIGAGAQILTYGGPITIGDRCSINPYCVLYGHGGLRIGNDVRIAAHTVIIPANHKFDDPDKTIGAQGLTKQGITIGSDVWIGAGVCILDGVSVAEGCVIGAGAVVTKSTEPYGVYAGVPARKISKRGSLVQA